MNIIYYKILKFMPGYDTNNNLYYEVKLIDINEKNRFVGEICFNIDLKKYELIFPKNNTFIGKIDFNSETQSLKLDIQPESNRVFELDIDEITEIYKFITEEIPANVPNL